MEILILMYADVQMYPGDNNNTALGVTLGSAPHTEKLTLDFVRINYEHGAHYSFFSHKSLDSCYPSFFAAALPLALDRGCQ